MYYVNENVVKLNRIFDQNSREGYLRTDLNENPCGLPQEFIDQVLSEVTSEFVAKYPETEPFQKYLASYMGIQPDELCVTNGSAEAIRHIFEVFSRPGGKIISVAPSYAMYEIYAKMYNRIHIPVAYSGLSISIEKIVEAIDDDTDIVVILNPNNPVGDVYSETEAEQIIQAAQKHEATVLIDEAYYYFCPNSFEKLVKKYRHVFLTRTFSKLFSMAGCRLGYCIGHADDIALVQKMCTPHNVNAFAMKFAYEVMRTPGMLQSLIDQQLRGKKYLIEELTRYGYFVSPSHGNFVLIQTKTDTHKLLLMLKEHKVLAKCYDMPDGTIYLRVTTGPETAMKQFLDAFLPLDKA